MSLRALRPYLLAVLLTVPGLALRFAHPDISPIWIALLSGLAILGASFLLTWACEVAQMDIPQAVAVAVVAASALVGFPVFEAVSPIGAVNKGLVFGGFAGAGTLVAIAIAELFVSRRVWCRSLCPLGGLFQVLGRAGQVNVHINHDACVHCGRCEEACLADPVILAPALSGDDVIVRAGDCMACGACVDTCPARALSFSLGRLPARAQTRREERDPVAES